MWASSISLWQRIVFGVDMMMYIERKTYEIKCLSPVHVGNGRTLKAFEYLYDRKAQKVYFVDEGKWIAFYIGIS